MTNIEPLVDALIGAVYEDRPPEGEVSLPGESEATQKAISVARSALSTAVALAVADRDSAEARLMLVLDYVAAERARRDNYNRKLAGHGGQEAGDSHSPRLPPSVLIEMERLLRDDQGEWVAKGIREQAERLARAEAALRRVVENEGEGCNQLSDAPCYERYPGKPDCWCGPCVAAHALKELEGS